jgi:hypothetical protein
MLAALNLRQRRATPRRRSAVTSSASRCCSCLALLLLLLPPQPAWASPFDPHPLPAREPFVEGWFVRVVDHGSNVSAAVIVGAFSNGSEYGGFGGPAGEAFVALLLQRPGYPPITRQSLLHGSAGGVNVTKDGQPITAPPVTGAPASFEYRSALGALVVANNGSSAAIDFAVAVTDDGGGGGGDRDAADFLRIEVNLSTRVPYSWAGPDVDGPEGYLPDALLPTHYWVQSLASQASYRITTNSNSITTTTTNSSSSSSSSAATSAMATGATDTVAIRSPHPPLPATVVASGVGALAHFEANWGSTFPSGWIWAQAIADEGTQLVLTGGNFTIAGVTTPQWIVSLRAPQLPSSNNGTVDFRTIDLDLFDTRIDCEGGAFDINASSSPLAMRLLPPPPPPLSSLSPWSSLPSSAQPHHSRINSKDDERLMLRVSLRAPRPSFSAPLFVPGRGGFSSSPGSIESYVALAEVTVARERDGAVLLAQAIPMAALEFGGTAQCLQPQQQRR